MQTSSLLRFLIVLGQLVVLVGCAGNLSQGLQQSLKVATPYKADFREIEYYAIRSKAAYEADDRIRSGFPNTTRVATVDDVKYFLETDPASKTQNITIRGTANKDNVLQDAETKLVMDSYLGVKLHSGFRDASKAVHADVKEHLNKDYAIRVTGHSLGGAVALILTNYLYKEGYRVRRLVTFGQPKVTDDKRNHDYKRKVAEHKLITRVVYDKDPVPMVPPGGGLQAQYGHVGPELILRDGKDYVFLDAHQADRLSVGDFWRNMGQLSKQHHKMDLYLENIRGKIRHGSNQALF